MLYIYIWYIYNITSYIYIYPNLRGLKYHGYFTMDSRNLCPPRSKALVPQAVYQCISATACSMNKRKTHVPLCVYISNWYIYIYIYTYIQLYIHLILYVFVWMCSSVVCMWRLCRYMDGIRTHTYAHMYICACVKQVKRKSEYAYVCARTLHKYT